MDRHLRWSMLKSLRRFWCHRLKHNSDNSVDSVNPANSGGNLLLPHLSARTNMLNARSRGLPSAPLFSIACSRLTEGKCSSVEAKSGINRSTFRRWWLLMVQRNDWKRSSFVTWGSRRARLTLLVMATGLIRSVSVWQRPVSVCTQKPSTQLTTTRAPSVTRRAAVTSEEKSTWPEK